MFDFTTMFITLQVVIGEYGEYVERYNVICVIIDGTVPLAH
jgi:hypothetical protein